MKNILTSCLSLKSSNKIKFLSFEKYKHNKLKLENLKRIKIYFFNKFDIINYK